MATVTGITAAKAQEIEDASVVSGAINSGNGHLILTTFGGSAIDAGVSRDDAGLAAAIANEVTNRNAAIDAAVVDAMAEVNDSDLVGTSTSGFTLASGWSTLSVQYEKVGRVVFLQITVTRSGATLSVPATGNFGNVDVLSAIPSALRPSYQVPLRGPSTGNGRVVGCVCNSSGVISINAVGGSSDFQNGEDFSAAGTWLAPSVS